MKKVCQNKDYHRGELFISFIQSKFKDLGKIDVLDIGCKYGIMSVPLSKKCKSVIGIDLDKKALEYTKEKAEGVDNLQIKELNFLKNKFKDNSFDLIIMEGVFEWIAKGSKNKSPIEWQKYALKECKRLLKPNGVIYVGIENKYCPNFWIKDPHGSLPLTVLLPNFLSAIAYKLIRNRSYRVNILGYSGYKKLFKDVFGNVDIKIPLPHYKHLYETSSFNKKELLSKIKKVSRIKNHPKTYRQILQGLKLVAKIGLTKVFAPNFIITSRKK